MVRINTIFKRLRGKRILILGFGREGKSSLAFIQKFLNRSLRWTMTCIRQNITI